MALQAVENMKSGIRVYESKHTDGSVVREHYHDVYQILYSLEGTGGITLNGEHHDIGSDQLAFIPPYCRHAVVSNTALTVMVLAFDGSLMNLLALIGERNDFGLKQPAVLTPEAIGEFRRLLRKLISAQYRYEEGSLGAMGMKLTLMEILLIVAGTGTGTGAGAVGGGAAGAGNGAVVGTSQAAGSVAANVVKPPRASSPYPDLIRQHIDEHYFEPLSLPDIAAKMGISTRYVNDIFKKQYTMTPMEYVTEVRIKLARKLLEETDKEIISICFEVGYDTLSTFYRAFKHAVHMSPNQYRQFRRSE